MGDLKTGNLRPIDQQQRWKVKGETLKTMMTTNKDAHIDIMKIDIEGSEWAFFNDIFETMQCPPVAQFAIEYHNFAFDPKYGSSPDVNEIHNFLNSCGFKSFFVRDPWMID